MVTKTKWTVLVYMAADTSASFYQDAMADVGEMVEAKFPEDVKVIVHTDAPSPWKGRCWSVDGKGGITPRVKANGSEACGHERVLDFVKESVEESDSDHYMLVLWGHGEGIDWKQKVTGPSVPTATPAALGADSAVNKRFALGSQNAVEVGDLGKALTNLELKNSRGEKLNPDQVVMGFDACLMGMVEVDYEIKKHVQWAFATSDEIPVAGWPYRNILNSLGKNPKIKPQNFAEKLVEICSTWYSENSPETKIGFATCNLLDGDLVRDNMEKLTSELRNHINEPKVWEAVRYARDFAEDLGEIAYVDLHAFCSELSRRIATLGYPATAELERAARVVNATLDAKFIVKHDFSNAYPGAYIKESRSLSICFPQTAEMVGSVPDLVVNWGSYRKLEFSEATKWPCFLEEFWALQRSTDRRKPSVSAKAAGC